jgi:dUTP pyrophosphatase
MENIKVPVQIIVTDERLREFGLPLYGSAGAAGADLRVMLESGKNGASFDRLDGVLRCTLDPGESAVFDTGIKVSLPSGTLVGLVFPRSGLGVKGLVIGNLTGVIDADYQGPLKLCLWNRGEDRITIAHGDRVAQYVIVPCFQAQFEEVTSFEVETERGEGGLGSTGVK